MPKPRLVKKKTTRGSEGVLNRLGQHLKLSHSEPEKIRYLKRIQEARAKLSQAKAPTQKEVFKNRLRKARAQLGKERKAA